MKDETNPISSSFISLPSSFVSVFHVTLQQMFRTFDLFIVFTISLVAGCTPSVVRVTPPSSIPTKTSTPSIFIGKPQVLEILERMSMQPRIYAVERPTKIDTQLVSIETARQNLTGFPRVAEMVGYYPKDLMVWLVIIKGKWWSAGPGGSPTATPGPYPEHMIVILDALTGDALLIQLEP